jgi:Mg-chelatase subunit ChlD
MERWRLILGPGSDPDGQTPLAGEQERLDEVLSALYDRDRKGGLGDSYPFVNRWLGDIRRYFPKPVVQVLQQDAMERLNIRKLLLEPELAELLEPNVELVATLVSLSKVLPVQSRETARELVRKFVRELEQRLRIPLVQAVRGALSRVERHQRPQGNDVDWHRTIRRNLRHYDPERKVVIPERFYGLGRKGRSLRHLIFLADQSGSMAASMVYSGLIGSIMASLSSIRTHFVAFDTEVTDLSSFLHDPVDLLFGVQLGGGTDINKALGYGQRLIQRPQDTILILLSDLYEGGSFQGMVGKAAAMKASGVNVIVLLALNDEGIPDYDKEAGLKLAALDIPCLAATPDSFPEIIAAAIQGHPLDSLLPGMQTGG